MGEAMGDFLDHVPDDKPLPIGKSECSRGSQTTSMYEDYEDWRKMTRPANENPQLQGTEFYDTLYRDLDIEIPRKPLPTRTASSQSAARSRQRPETQTYQYSYTRESNTEHHIRYYQTISGLEGSGIYSRISKPAI